MQTVYVEKQILGDCKAQAIIARCKNARIIEIDHYSEIFNPKAQNFRIQKKNPAIILARKQNRFVLPAPADYNIGGTHNYYFSHMMNCIYDCRYCFLQGMYASANYVIFINYSDFFSAITHQVEQHPGPSWYFSGYDCDSLALEPITQFSEACLDFFAKHPRAHLELRTKSTQIRHLISRKPLQNCVVAYSLSPSNVADAVEHKAPSLSKRIEALQNLQQNGWHIGLRFDPLLRAENFKRLYIELFDNVFDALDTNKIHSVSLGPFRLPKPYFKKLIQLYPDEPILAETFSEKNNLVSYAPELEADMLQWCSDQILRRVSAAQFFPCA